jgi:hypothetical protein
MAALEVIALDTSVPQLMAPQAGDTYTFPRAVEMPLGTANGVLYLNGSKVVTSGSALTFDGSIVSNTGVGFNVNNANALYRFQNGSGTRTGYLQVRADAFEVWSDQSAVPMVFGASNAEQMRLNSTGLGIGTSSPQSRLEARQDQAGAITRVIVNNNNATAGSGSSFDYYFGTTRLGGLTHAFSGSAYLGFDVWNGSAATERMRLDSSGNLGLGATPSAWGTAKAFQIGGSGFALSSNAAGAGDGSLTWNGYYNGTNWIYSYTGGVATRYRQNESGHAWFISTDPTPTAGAPISFTQAMTLDASGNLLVGGTSLWSSERLGITGSSASQRFIYARTTSNGHYLSLGTNGTLPYIEYGNGAGLAFTDGATERARIDASGNLGLGVTPSVGYGKEFTFSADITSNIGGLGTRNLATNNGLVYLSSNTKNTGAFTDAYWLSAAATKYTQNNGVHAWFTAASGTAGNPISFTQAMTLEASGNLLVGTTTTPSASNPGVRVGAPGQN